MATAGRSKEDAQSLICQAIADGILKFRAKLGQHTTRPMYGGKRVVFEEKDFRISPDLQRENFDWEQSRPLNPWGVRREVINLPGISTCLLSPLRTAYSRLGTASSSLAARARSCMRSGRARRRSSASKPRSAA